jgi:hypothetical protein
MCLEQLGQGKITCECRTTFLATSVQNCLQKSCKPKDIFATLNAVATSCNEPRRDKSKSFRTIIAVFFALASLSVMGRYATHISVGRTDILDNANMGVANGKHSFWTSY